MTARGTMSISAGLSVHGEILRCGLKFTTPRLVRLGMHYATSPLCVACGSCKEDASLVASERKLRMTARTLLKSAHGKSSLKSLDLWVQVWYLLVKYRIY